MTKDELVTALEIAKSPISQDHPLGLHHAQRRS